MDRENFLNLEVEQQVLYFNQKMKAGASMTAIAKHIGISKSISEKFKKRGYILQEGQFINSSPEEQQKVVPKIGRPERKEKGQKHTVIIADNVWEELRIYAIKNKTTASNVIEKLIADYLKL